MDYKTARSERIKALKQRTPRQQAWNEVATILNPEMNNTYNRYRNNWAGFIERELHQYIPDMLREVITAVMENEVVIVPSATQVGKSWLGAMLSIAFYKIYKESQVYIMAAPPRANLEGNLMAKIKQTAVEHQAMFAEDTMNVLKIYRSPEERIEGLIIPSSKSPEEKETRFSGRHSPYMMAIIDEGDGVPDEIYRAVEGWGSGGLLFRQIIFFNPKSRLGEAYKMIDEKRAKVINLSAFDHPNVVTGKAIIPGAVMRKDIVRRVAAWTVHKGIEYKPEDGEDVFTLPEYLVGETATDRSGEETEPLPPGVYAIRPEHNEFAYKVLGRYPIDDASRTIPSEWIEAARARYDAYVERMIAMGEPPERPPLDIRPRMGMDVAGEGKDSNAVCFRWDNFVEFHRKGGINALKAADWGAKLYHEKNPVRAAVDENGIGAAVPPRMFELGCDNVKGVMTQEVSQRKRQLGRFRRKRDELIWMVREWLKPPLSTAMLPDERRLILALEALTHKEENGKIVIMPKRKLLAVLGYSPDELDALALTFDSSGTTFDTI